MQNNADALDAKNALNSISIIIMLDFCWQGEKKGQTEWVLIGDCFYDLGATRKIVSNQQV